MLNFVQFDDTLDVIANTPEIFSMNHTEACLFRPHADLMEEAGSWARILKHLIFSGNSEGQTCGVKWKNGSATARVEVRGGNTIRFARWVRVSIGEKILIAALMPHLYTSATGNPYVDYRFVVCCSDESIVPLVMLFTDQIIGQADGDDSWKTEEQGSMSSVSTTG